MTTVADEEPSSSVTITQVEHVSRVGNNSDINLGDSSPKSGHPVKFICKRLPRIVINECEDADERSAKHKQKKTETLC